MATLKLLFWQCLEDSLWIYRCSVAIAGVAAKIGIKFLYDTKGFQMIFMMVTFNAMSTLQSFAIFHEIWWVWVQEVQVHPGAGSAPKAPFTQVSYIIIYIIYIVYIYISYIWYIIYEK